MEIRLGLETRAWVVAAQGTRSLVFTHLLANPLNKLSVLG